MPVFTPYAAQEIAMVSSTPAGSGLPIGLMPGALPSDHASRQTLKTTAMRLLFGHSQSAFLGTAFLRIFYDRRLAAIATAATGARRRGAMPGTHAGGLA